MKKILDQRIPTILGILLVALGIPLTTFILKSETAVKSKASNSQTPRDVKITNISDKSFTITYLTDVPATGSISYGYDKKLGQSELEDIDKEKGSFSPKKIHSIAARKLTPATKYYLTIISGSETFLSNGIPFEATTGPNISSSSAKQHSIKGKILLPDGNAPSEALVYLNSTNSQLLSSTVTEDGKFSFSLKELRNDDLTDYFNIDQNTIFTIFATNGSLKSKALISLNQVDSIPPITLSNDYDFTQESSPTASKSADLSSGFPLDHSSVKNLKPEIINPKTNQSLTEQKPQFRGTSLPNEKVEIIIHSAEELTAQVVADNNGNWTYRPETNLSPGDHTITIKTRDSTGILRTITQSFTVFAAEVPAATPVIPTATPTRIVLPTATSTPILTPTPTAPLVNIPSPTVTILIPLSTSMPSPIDGSSTPVPEESKGGLPPTGNSYILISIGGIITTIAGIALFLLTRTVL